MIFFFPPKDGKYNLKKRLLVTSAILLAAISLETYGVIVKDNLYIEILTLFIICGGVAFFGIVYPISERVIDPLKAWEEKQVKTVKKKNILIRLLFSRVWFFYELSVRLAGLGVWFVLVMIVLKTSRYLAPILRNSL